MPINFGKNLELNDSRLSAIYNGLYDKLNIAKAWVNGSTTVYTTRSAKVGDNIYNNVNSLSVLTTIKTNNGTSIVGNNGITYTYNSSKNSSFQFIPVETSTETLTVNDFLNITKGE